MSSNTQKRTVLLCYMRFKRYARCALMRNYFLSADRKQQQIENSNIANQIHGFTINYGKFILKLDRNTENMFSISLIKHGFLTNLSVRRVQSMKLDRNTFKKSFFTLHLFLFRNRFQRTGRLHSVEISQKFFPLRVLT